MLIYLFQDLIVGHDRQYVIELDANLPAMEVFKVNSIGMDINSLLHYIYIGIINPLYDILLIEFIDPFGSPWFITFSCTNSSI